MAAPPTSPSWLVNPISPTPVARDAPDTSVLMEIIAGKVTLNSPVDTDARATEGQIPRGKAKRASPQAPPAAMMMARRIPRLLRLVMKAPE